MKLRSKYILAFLILLVTVSCRKTIETEPRQSFGSNLVVINDEFNGKDVVVAGNEGLQLLVAFERRAEDGTVLEMSKTSLLPLPAICEDQEGNTWNLFGECVMGDRLGEKLPILNSTTGFYFSFNSMFQGAEIYGDAEASGQVNLMPGEEWLVDESFVFTIGGFDAIPSVDEPQFELYRSKDYLTSDFHVKADDRVTILKLGEEIRAYPHNILTRHEIVNDEIGGIPISLNFCPLTGTSYCWKRNGNSYGVSGMLYNNNLILYDRDTESLWSQLLGLSIFGPTQGTQIEGLSIIETTFETYQNLYDFQGKVMTLQTGYVFNYVGNPYFEYDAAHEFLLFPLQYEDDRLLNKERVLGVEVDGKCKVYPYSIFN